MDPVTEKSELLSLVGSFYTKSVAYAQRKQMHLLSHLAMANRTLSQLQAMGDAVLSGNVFNDNYKIIRFTDKDIVHYGVDHSIQQRQITRTGNTINTARYPNITLDDQALPADDRGLLAADSPLSLPLEYGDALTLPSDVQLEFGLRIDPNIYVRAIELPSGKLLNASVDFQSYYGCLKFHINPIALFPEMKLVVQSYQERKPNILNYTLSLNDVYGPVDRVLTYYRKSQTVNTLYHAAAQAAGFPVMPEDCEILNVTPLDIGYCYWTSCGRFEANFNHQPLELGTKLEAGDVIGKELFFITSDPAKISPNCMGVSLDRAIPVKGLVAQNAETTLYVEGRFRPTVLGPTPQVTKYYQYLDEVSNHQDLEVAPTGNAMLHYLSHICANRAIIVHVDTQRLPQRVQNRIWEFVEREYPLGSVLFEVIL